jgi:hypothetical protein
MERGDIQEEGADEMGHVVEELSFTRVGSACTCTVYCPFRNNRPYTSHAPVRDPDGLADGHSNAAQLPPRLSAFPCHSLPNAPHQR